MMTACTGASAQNTAPDTLTPVSISFYWFHTSEFAGFFIADRDAYYRDAGLQVTLKEGDIEAAELPVEQVIAGEAEFELVSTDQLLTYRSQGQPLVALATVYQQYPDSIAVLADSGITHPRDLIGKRVGVYDNDYFFTALLRRYDIDPAQVEMIPNLAYIPEALADGSVDATAMYFNMEALQARRMGIDVRLMLYADYGINAYVNVIFTTETMIAEQPEVVEAFLAATLRGYQAAIASPEQAVEYTLLYNPELEADAELESFLASVPVIAPVDTPIGMMNAAVWESSYGLLTDNAAFSEPFDVREAYTLDFLNRIYASNEN
jgi:ABC-type nitrate/sulfonate/bicarbonate transport system substrate-binding protein